MVPHYPLGVGILAHDFSWGSGSLLLGTGCSCSMSPRSLGATQLVFPNNSYNQSMLWKLSPKFSEDKKCSPGRRKSSCMNLRKSSALLRTWVSLRKAHFVNLWVVWGRGYSKDMAVQCRWNSTGYNSEQNLPMLNPLWISVSCPGLGSKH